MKNKKGTVFVGLSGGVDSSVSAALLKKDGYDVVGVFMRTWHPDFLPCTEEAERRDAMRVAAHLDIPFLTFDFEKEYKKGVGDYMIREYKAGRTPNPDVMCNKEVKFGAFLNKAIKMGANYIATGHYARTGAEKSRGAKKSLTLLRGKDSTKDQSYFLWTLNQAQLSRTLFPIGHLPKTETRKLAKKFNLPVAEKKDSQGICFLGQVDLKNFLKHYIPEKKGKVVDEKGKVIGWHDGARFYTLGERRGFVVTKKSPNDTPYYIVKRDVKKNILVVSKNRIPAKDFYILKNLNWISETPEKERVYNAEIRYHGEKLPCKIVLKGHGAEVKLENAVTAAEGQSMVIYDGDVCLGGGVII
ncbi:MAG TPA: tRNA 2-thiouridine(34) synthase MnmA [Candidatus Paceibacterota bacterium]|nr:tRNA 2-thiouridine(34) synthase MnmA [Candidatus Paceibacterota bacterium]